MTPLEIDGCKVVFSGGSFAELDGYLSENAARISKTVILCDTNSHEHCLPLMAENLPSLTDYEIIEVEPGEENKNLDTCRSLWEALSDMHADRRTLMINLGGGVVCDMGGFTASCYMRGIDFINVPTTLLSQVDASVGGKTGVDLGGLKNIVGLFSLPRMVVVNPLFIQSLPQKEVLSGFAEMIKHGLIRDRRHWEELSSRADFSLQDTGRLVYDSVKIKYDVVLEDPTEKGLRKTLNFGRRNVPYGKRKSHKPRPCGGHRHGMRNVAFFKIKRIGRKFPRKIQRIRKRTIRQRREHIDGRHSAYNIHNAPRQEKHRTRNQFHVARRYRPLDNRQLRT